MRTCAVVAAVGLGLPSAAGFVAPNAGVIKVSHAPAAHIRSECVRVPITYIQPRAAARSWFEWAFAGAATCTCSAGGTRIGVVLTVVCALLCFHSSHRERALCVGRCMFRDS